MNGEKYNSRGGLHCDPSGMHLRLAEAHGTGRTGNERKRKYRERHGGSKVYR